VKTHVICSYLRLAMDVLCSIPYRTYARCTNQARDRLVRINIGSWADTVLSCVVDQLVQLCNPAMQAIDAHEFPATRIIVFCVQLRTKCSAVGIPNIIIIIIIIIHIHPFAPSFTTYHQQFLLSFCVWVHDSCSRTKTRLVRIILKSVFIIRPAPRSYLVSLAGCY